MWLDFAFCSWGGIEGVKQELFQRKKAKRAELFIYFFYFAFQAVPIQAVEVTTAHPTPAALLPVMPLPVETKPPSEGGEAAGETKQGQSVQILSNSTWHFLEEKKHISNTLARWRVLLLL